MYALAVCACLCLCACGGDDKNDVTTPPSAPSSNTGSDNTADLAVTGGVLILGPSYASIRGYINVDQVSAMLVESFGIEYYTNAQSAHFIAQTNKYTGREFAVDITGLKPNTTYYYRAFVKQLSGLTQYGKVLSFTTEKVKIDVEASYSWARISPQDEIFAEYELFYSTKKDQDFKKYQYYDDNITSIMPYTSTIEGLAPGTTYYCYLQNSKTKSDVFSFTTKALPFDLSGVSATYKFTPAYDSYKDEDGKTHDLKWLGGTYTISITSNLGNQVKYGILGIKGLKDASLFDAYKTDKERLFYSESTSSPYTIEVKAWADDHAYGTNIAPIEALVERVNEGDATHEDYWTLYDLLRQCEPAEPYIQAFIEYNGEQIYIGKVY